MRERTYIIPFVQGTTGNTLGNDYGSTSHINPWVLLSDNTKKIHLYGYDDNNSAANKWYLNLLDKNIENDISSNQYSLKYAKKDKEEINIDNFNCNTLSVELEKELNRYYELKYIIIAFQKQGFDSIDYYERFEISGNEDNIYHFNINKILRVKDINKCFIFGLQYRQNCNENDTQIEVYHDPKNTFIFNLKIHGKNNSNNRYEINYNDNTKSFFDYRPYRKRFYIRDIRDIDNEHGYPSYSEHGYLSYSTMKETYRYISNNLIYTLYEFTITKSVLYNIVVKGNEPNNNVFVNELKISHGKLVLTIIGNGHMFYPDKTKVEFCEVELLDSELDKVPDREKKLTIVKIRSN